MSITIEIDTSELDSLVDGLKKRLTPAQVDRVMSSVLRDTAEHTKNILKRAIPEHYYATPGEVGKAVGKASVTSGGLGVGCCIPITGVRKSIGGGFSATGGARGWESLRKRYRVKARIVKGAQSTLPQNMSSYGGQAPFRNLGPSLRSFKDANGNTIARGAIGPDGAFEKYPKSSLGRQVFTRGAKGRLPIKKVVGIAIPQMAANHAREDIEAGIREHLEKSTAEKLNALVRGGG